MPSEQPVSNEPPPARPPERFTHFREDANHAWSVHALLVAGCAALLYLTIANWGQAPLHLTKLEELRDIVRPCLTNKPLRPAEALLLQPQLSSKNLERIRTALRGPLGEVPPFSPAARNAARTLFKVRQASGFEKPDSPNFFAALESPHLIVRRPSGKLLNTNSSLPNWIRDRQESCRISVTQVQVAPLGWSEVDVQIQLKLRAVPHAASLQTETKLFTARLALKDVSVWDDEHLWNGRGELREWLEANGLLTTSLDEARQVAKNALTSSVPDDQRIGGLVLNAAHLGVFGPIVLLGLLLYVVLQAHSLQRRLERMPASEALYLRATSRWAIVSNRPSAGIETTVSFQILPPIACFLAAWRLSEGGVSLGILFAVLGLTVGSWAIPPREDEAGHRADAHEEDDAAELGTRTIASHGTEIRRPPRQLTASDERDPSPSSRPPTREKTHDAPGAI